MREWVKAIPIGLGLPIIIGAASVKPEDAATNLAAWAYLLGFEQVPSWLQNPSTDRNAIVGSLAVGAAYAFLVWAVPALKQKEKTVESGQGINDISVVIEPNIGASDAFFMILADSVWKRQQEATTIVSQNTRRDWLSFRLNKEVHNALRNGQIAAWGEECREGMVTTPEKQIPADVWDGVELDFNSDPRLPRTPACLKGRVTWELGRSLWTGVRFCREQVFRRFPLVSVTSQGDLARQLDNLYARGVGERNRLMPTLPDFDLDKERRTFIHWDHRVLALFDTGYVNVAEKSAFRTLNLFHPISLDAPNKTAEQRHIEAMWTEKLNRLKPIIARIGR